MSDLVTILAGDVREQRERYVRLWRRLQRLSEPCSGCGRLHFFGKYRAAKGDPVPPNRSYCPECNRRRLASYQCDNRCGTYAVPFLRDVPTGEEIAWFFSVKLFSKRVVRANYMRITNY